MVDIVSTAVESNFTSTDKLYLLSTHEVWEDADGNKSSYDTAYNSTRRLDYYKNVGVIKKNESSNSWWWLRSAISNNNYRFCFVGSNGYWNHDSARSVIGVSPAFRLG